MVREEYDAITSQRTVTDMLHCNRQQCGLEHGTMAAARDNGLANGQMRANFPAGRLRLFHPRRGNEAPCNEPVTRVRLVAVVERAPSQRAA